MRMVRVLFGVSALALAGTGVGYLIFPAAMLGVVGIAGEPTSEFLIRTEGVALLAAAAFLLLVPVSGGWRTRIALVAIAAYLVVGSVVDLRAFADGIVGPASVPSAGVRIAIGALCVFAAVRRPRAASAGGAPTATPEAADPARF